MFAMRRLGCFHTVPSCVRRVFSGVQGCATQVMRGLGCFHTVPSCGQGCWKGCLGFRHVSRGVHRRRRERRGVSSADQRLASVLHSTLLLPYSASFA